MEKEEKKLIVGYAVPSLTKEQAKNEPYLVVMPVFVSEKGLYKKSDVFPTVEAAKKELERRYGDEKQVRKSDKEDTVLPV